MQSASSVNAWRSYWDSTGVPAIDLFADTPVADQLRHFWSPHLDRLRNHRIIDIGAGSGALAGIALQLKVQVGQWICLDIAETASKHWPRQKSDNYNPSWVAGSLEMTAPTAPMECAISNFGVEYSDLAVAAEKTKAWLGSSTEIVWVIHAKDSLIDEQSAQTLQDLEFLRNQTNFISAARQLLKLAVDVPEDPTDRMMHGVDERDAYNREVNQLKSYMQAQGRRSPVLVQTLQFCNSAIAAQLQRKANELSDLSASPIDGFFDSLETERNRLEQMRAASLDPVQLNALAESLSAAGFAQPQLGRIDMPIAVQGPMNRLIAWTLVSTRSI